MTFHSLPRRRPRRPRAPESGGPPDFYVATNSVEVTLRDIGTVGATLAATLDAGANSVDQIWFDIDDPIALEQQARSEAMTEARNAAEHLAQLSGVQLGAVMSVTESGQMQPMGMPMAMSMPPLAAHKASLWVPVAPGELSIVQSVQVVYAITR